MYIFPVISFMTFIAFSAIAFVTSKVTDNDDLSIYAYVMAIAFSTLAVLCGLGIIVK